MPDTLERHAVALVPSTERTYEEVCATWANQDRGGRHAFLQSAMVRFQQNGCSYLNTPDQLTDARLTPFRNGAREPIYRLVDGEMRPIDGRWYDTITDKVHRSRYGHNSLSALFAVPSWVFDSDTHRFGGVDHYGRCYVGRDVGGRPYIFEFTPHEGYVAMWTEFRDSWKVILAAGPWRSHDQFGLLTHDFAEVPRSVAKLLVEDIYCPSEPFDAARRERAFDALADSRSASLFDLIDIIDYIFDTVTGPNLSLPAIYYGGPFDDVLSS